MKHLKLVVGFSVEQESADEEVEHTSLDLLNEINRAIDRVTDNLAAKAGLFLPLNTARCVMVEMQINLAMEQELKKISFSVPRAIEFAVSRSRSKDRGRVNFVILVDFEDFEGDELSLTGIFSFNVDPRTNL